MITKVVFFRYLPLTQKVYHDFYLEELMDAGFKVEYWYLPFIIDIPDGMENYNHPCVRRFYSYIELERALKKEDKPSTLFNSIQTYGWPVIRLFWLMTKHNCRLSVFGRNTLPVSTHSSARNPTILLSFHKMTNALKSRVASFIKNHNFIKSYDIIFLGGRNGINGYGQVTKKERIESTHIFINGNDYDRYLRLKESERILPEKFVVFLDECIPLHPDSAICEIKSINLEIYFDELNAFFDRIEEETGLQVIIAAHPKALAYHKRNYFNGRKVLFGKSAELVRDSEFVLAHDSTSIGYVVCFEKPMISMTSDEFAKQQINNHWGTVCTSEYLGTKLVYINRYCEGSCPSINFHDITVDRNKYEQYKYDFLTNPETENIQSNTLVIEGIKQIK